MSSLVDREGPLSQRTVSSIAAALAVQEIQQHDARLLSSVALPSPRALASSRVAQKFERMPRVVLRSAKGRPARLPQPAASVAWRDAALAEGLLTARPPRVAKEDSETLRRMRELRLTRTARETRWRAATDAWLAGQQKHVAPHVSSAQITELKRVYDSLLLEKAEFSVESMETAMQVCGFADQSRAIAERLFWAMGKTSRQSLQFNDFVKFAISTEFRVPGVQGTRHGHARPQQRSHDRLMQHTASSAMRSGSSGAGGSGSAAPSAAAAAAPGAAAAGAATETKAMPAARASGSRPGTAGGVSENPLLFDALTQSRSVAGGDKLSFPLHVLAFKRRRLLADIEARVAPAHHLHSHQHLHHASTYALHGASTAAGSGHLPQTQHAAASSATGGRADSRGER